MNICMVTPWKVKCGIATYSEALVKALAGEGCKVYVTRLHRFSVKDERYLETLAVRRIPEKVDVIHVQHEYGLYPSVTGVNLEEGFYSWLRSHRVPVVTTMHCTGVRRDVDQSVVEKSDEVIVHNEFMKQQLGWKCQIIPHGCQPSKCLDKKSARSLLELPLDKFIAVCFGMCSPYKGLEEVFEALRAVPDSILLVTGGWPTEVHPKYIDDTKRLAERVLPDRVKWMGWVPVDKLSAVFGASDVGILNHKYASESGALLTALGFGKCMVTSPHPAFKEKEPILLTHSGVQDLGAKLRDLKEHPAKVKEYERKARKYAKQVSWTNIAKKHIALYQELV